VGYIFIAWLNLKSKPGLLRQLVVVSLVVMVFFAIAGAGVGITLNGLMDSSKPTNYIVNVVGKYEKKITGQYHHYIKVEKWGDGKHHKDILVTPIEYDRIIPGVSQFCITINEGKFNYPWRQSYHFTSRKDLESTL
jgi:hypothetical protein